MPRGSASAFASGCQSPHTRRQCATSTASQKALKRSATSSGRAQRRRQHASASGHLSHYSAPIVCDRPEGREIAHGAVGRGRPRGWGQRRGSTASAKGKCGRVSVIWKGGFAARLPKSRPRLMTAGNKLIAARVRKSPWKLCNRYNRSSIAAGSGR